MVTRRHTVYYDHRNALLNTNLDRIVCATLIGWTFQCHIHFYRLIGQVGCLRNRCMSSDFSIDAAA